MVALEELAASGSASARPLVTGFTAGCWHFVDGADGRLYFRPTRTRCWPRRTMIDVRIDVRGGLDEAAAATVVVAESRDTLVDAAIANGRLLVASLRNASSRLATWSLDGRDDREIALPGLATIAGLAARWHDARSFATVTSFTMPPTIMTCDLDAGRLAFAGRVQERGRPMRER